MSGDSDQFEKELEEFFQDRAKFRSVSISDPSKKLTKENRCETEKVQFPENPQSNMSGCCMAGCHDCPWGYSDAESSTQKA